MPRGKDQKTIAKRIDLHYWSKSHPLRTARKLLVLACVVLAAGWMAYAFGTKNERIYNPGHVTSAHATIENNCAACHAADPNRPGQFSKAVSDSACMVCHEAPMHAPTQLVREGDNAGNILALAAYIKDIGNGTAKQGNGEGEQPPAEGAADAAPPADAASQPADSHHAGRLVSAQCAACHVEHRGREALAAVSNNHCTQCHEDLSKAVASGKKAEVPNRVVAFTSDDHPAFGRMLPKNEKGDGWVDNTKLKFNHKVHLVDQKLNDCSMCHTTWEPNLSMFRPGRDAAKPPFKVDAMPPLDWASTDGRYMKPVNYEQHCQACHPIKVTGMKVDFVHDRIEVVRAQLLATFQESALDRYTAGDPGAAAAAPKTGGGRRGSSAKPAGPADEGDWLRGELEKLNKNVTAVQKSCAKCHEMEGQKPAVAGGPAPEVSEQRLRSWLEAAARDDAVMPALWEGGEAEVHLAMQQQRRSRRPGGAGAAPEPAPGAAPAEGAAAPAPGAAATPAAPAAAKPKPRKPIKPAELQATVPTGITTSPRRWFTNSRFDHRSHRDMACVECHAKLHNADKVDGIENEQMKTLLTTATTDTKEVLSPGMTWKTYAFTQAGEGKWSVAESSRSCTECHRQDTGTQRFATAACVTCHAYHDHSKEMYPDGRPEPRAAATAMAAPAPASAEAAPAEAPPAETPADPAPAEAAPAEAAPAEAAPTEAVPADAAPAEAPPAEPAPSDAAAPPADAAASPAEATTPPAAETPAPSEAKPADEAQPAPAEETPSPAPARKSRRPKSTSGA